MNENPSDEEVEAFYSKLNAPTMARLERLKQQKLKVAHYTTAANALNIITGKTLWLRNAALMNDFMELSYGKTCLVGVLEATLGRLEQLIETHHKDLVAEVINWLTEVEFTINTQTYLTSFAECGEDEQLGKLSMWRAYGGPVAGAAIVFNVDSFERPDTQLNIFAHPVVYGPQEFAENFNAVLASLEANQDAVRDLPREIVKSILYHTLQDMVMTTKHPGFYEEQEWRIIHSPFRFASAFVMPSPEVVGGIPQMVYKVRLEEQAGLDMPELTMDRLIHRVIIGPCQYPIQVAHTIEEALGAAGVQEPGKRIKLSGIPLRQQG